MAAQQHKRNLSDDRRNGSSSVSIFLPSSLRYSRSGWILGWWWEGPNSPTVYVLAILHNAEPSSQVLVDRCTSTEGNVGFMPSILGEFKNRNCGEMVTDVCASKLLREISQLHLQLKVTDDGFHLDKVSYKGSIVDIYLNCKLFIYDPNPLLVSELFSNKTGGQSIFLKEEFEEYTCVEKLLNVLYQWQQLRLYKIDEITNSVTESSQHIQMCPSLPSESNHWFYKLIHSFKPVLKRLTCSGFLCQMGQRLKQMFYILNPSSHQCMCLRCWNVLSSLSVDALLGLLILYHLLSWISVEQIFELFIYSADKVVDNLHSLIHWLMGVPAGLKLNYPLNSALGNYFLYHIYLWKTYIETVKPILQGMLKLTTFFGWLGITFQLSMLSDLISLATFHIYCFYVYAARLYHLHLSGLSSLWYLVRGKKWNPLRQRVDSCAYSVNQLFLGTLMFMILLFLLPTTMVYYVVFTSLRLSVLVALGVLNRLVVAINIIPGYTFVKYIENSSVVADNILFTVSTRQTDHQPITLQMRVSPSSMKSVCKNSLPPDFTNKEYVSWGTIFNDLIWGNLIYPI